jgi:hypothetical protein
MVVQGGLFADNKVNVDTDRDEFVTVDAAKVVGESDSYRNLMVRKRLADRVCRNAHIGIELHTQLKTPKAPPIVIKNVEFSGFSHLTCADALPFSMDPSVSRKHNDDKSCRTPILKLIFVLIFLID